MVSSLFGCANWETSQLEAEHAPVSLHGSPYVSVCDKYVYTLMVSPVYPSHERTLLPADPEVSACVRVATRLRERIGRGERWGSVGSPVLGARRFGKMPRASANQ